MMRRVEGDVARRKAPKEDEDDDEDDGEECFLKRAERKKRWATMRLKEEEEEEEEEAARKLLLLFCEVEQLFLPHLVSPNERFPLQILFAGTRFPPLSLHLSFPLLFCRFSLSGVFQSGPRPCAVLFPFLGGRVSG